MSIPSLQTLCAQQIRKNIDLDLSSQEGHTLVPTGPSSLSLTTAWLMENILPFLKQHKSEEITKLPCGLIELIEHPYALVEWRKHFLKEGSPQLYPTVAQALESVWRKLCEQKGWLPKKEEPEMSWENRYFKERIAHALLHSYGNFEEINLKDWCLFYENRERIQVLEFNNNPWIEKKKLKELCALFSEVTTFRVNQCSAMEEKDWVETFYQLKHVEHADLGNHMSIGSKALNALATNASHLRSLNIASIAYSVDLEAILNLLHNSPQLTTLVLGEKKQLQTLPQLIRVIKACPVLTSLELRDFNNLKTTDMDAIQRQFPKIELKNCGKQERA